MTKYEAQSNRKSCFGSLKSLPIDIWWVGFISFEAWSGIENDIEKLSSHIRAVSVYVKTELM